MTYDEAINLKSFKNYCTCGGHAPSMNGRDPNNPHMAWCPQFEEHQEWRAALATGPATTVVNVKDEPCEVYIGRGTTFGNPFHIGPHGSRDEVLEMYRKHFRLKLKEAGFHERVMALKGKRLGCNCKPKACHGDIIKEYIETGKV